MRHLLLILLLLSGISACDSGASSGGSDRDLVVAVGDTLRAVRLHVPDGVAPGAEVSLLIAFHGSSDTGKGFQGGAGLDESAWDDMIIAYPTAAKGNWAEGCNCNIADRLQIDDLGFVEAIVDTVSALYTLRRERTFALGFSQGGLFAYRVACEMGDRFAGIAAVSAPMSVPLSRACRLNTPVSTMVLHGKKDGVLPWDGTNNGSFSLLSAVESAGVFVDRYDCAPSIKTTLRSGSASVIETRWADCQRPAQVRLYEIPTGVHAWYTRDPDNRQLLLDFFADASVTSMTAQKPTPIPTGNR